MMPFLINITEEIQKLNTAILRKPGVYKLTALLTLMKGTIQFLNGNSSN